MMVRRFLLIVVVLHVLYAALWLLMDSSQRQTVERYLVPGAEITALVFYLILIVAFFEARKTRLNVALAIQKLYWALLIGLLALPFAFGWWTPPAWLRTYIWIGLAVSLIGVLYEFYRANWGNEPEPTYPEIERRSNPYGRRSTDYATAHGGPGDQGLGDMPSRRDGGDY